MDTKRLITSIAIVAAVFAVWMGFMKFYHPPMVTEPDAPVAPVVQSSDGGAPSTNPATTQAGSTSAPSLTVALHAVPATAPGTGPVLLGSATLNDPNYVLQLAITPSGAGIDQVTLNPFKSSDADLRKKNAKEPYRFESAIPGNAGTQPLATRSLILHAPGGDRTVDLLGIPWERSDDGKDPNSATFSVTVADASGPVAQVSKTYRVQTRQAAANTHLGYEVSIEQSVKNLTAQALTARLVMNGPTPPPAELENGTDRMVVVGYAEAGKSVAVTQHLYGEFKPEEPEKDLSKDGEKHSLWAGQASTYFAAIVLPTNTDQAAQISVRGRNLGVSSSTDQVVISFETPDLAIAPQQQATVPLSVYFGPKSRAVLETTYYSIWPRMYNQLLAIRSSMCGFLSFPWIINALVGLLRFFHMILRDWGLAIICLVLLVRAALHPITKRSQTQMMKMGKMGPEIERLKKKYADQPDVLNKEMMKVYKEQGAAPILGCLPMFLQMPIWIALWTALQGTFELRQEPFLYGLTWIKDLAKPDALFSFAHPIAIPMTSWHIYSINLLPMLMAVATYINQKYFTPMPPAATPEQESTQKMTRRMSVIFPLMFYGLPSGLNLYYLTSMTLGILEGKIIRDHIKQKEEAEKAGRVFVQTKPTRGSKMRNDPEPEAKKPTGLWGRMLGVMEQAQQKAEEIRKEQEKKKK
ncbi:MAG TPA: membrane protein insertase YidC [Tepidisphaeraceae bacterium]|jgi:YidC/Oxa1 family membrane protein insertase|nr:membrane protein insertase YidC [Tepidisphaeraceae bacterium]